ncbi:cytochrome c oxidase subunit NDUFA4-like [Aplysia californica]|uniref:Cytochrome c oxidase subunit NDUFA4-like n=1 Tax=Aplysia californica TaxID=6500 RepID=A0ABM0JXV4_APLCA|nr:cytochrome c oxidase subunit NDUFA4-like [Aplysia californica]
MPMAGLTMASLKKHPSLVPLFVCVGGGMAWAAYYIGRLSLRSPDVGWSQKHEGMANTRWPVNKQYKFYSPIRDYSKLENPKERPQL